MVMLSPGDITTREVLEWQGLHLLHFVGSTCSKKVRIALAIKGLNWTSHHVDLVKRQNYSDWFMGINPRGLVPVLVHDGQVHIESNDILDYLEQLHPTPPLMPEEHVEIAHVEFCRLFCPSAFNARRDNCEENCEGNIY